ncbi:HdeD family acid-resistance protein [Roseibium polysiphoniae]|uniref:HdeD family acid-resistance protein n=2 Tax=Roseibium polysiphoniae TaxID=2571221 RepID=A0A944CE92_9HYPH|nr:HdeD family acid-resistance protein [Roseibium polysiphoniae]
MGHKMTDISSNLPTDFKAALKEGKSSLMWVGILMAIVGAIAIIFPFAATVTTNYMVGFLFLFSGALGVWHSFAIKGTGPFFGALLMGLITVVAGVFLLANPLEGILLLTLTVGIVFIFEGAYQIFAAFELRPTKGWGWMLVSAVISIAAGLLIVSKLPGTSLFVLGLIMGINFLSTGLSMIMLSKAVGDTQDGTA